MRIGTTPLAQALAKTLGDQTVAEAAARIGVPADELRRVASGHAPDQRYRSVFAAHFDAPSPERVRRWPGPKTTRAFAVSAKDRAAIRRAMAGRDRRGRAVPDRDPIASMFRALRSAARVA